MGILDGFADTTAGRQFTATVDELREGDLAGALDESAGMKDESIARQFDDEPGGGFADLDTFVSIADGSNTEDTPNDVGSILGDFVGRTTGTNPYEDGPNPLGPLGRVIEWVFSNPQKAVAVVAVLYLAPLLTSVVNLFAGVVDG